MRTFAMCAMVLVLVAFFASQAESRAGPSPHDVVLEANVQPFDDTVAETEFYQEGGESLAQVFPTCGFQGQARDVGTPMIINGHNNVASLKVPSGQCVSLFSKEGYNDGTAGEMLAIRGPMNVACLSGIKTRDGQSTWLQAARSYKMGPCEAKPTVAMASAAVKTAAMESGDLSELSTKALAAASGEFGSIMSSFTKADKNDGVAYPYDQHKLSYENNKLEGLATGVQVHDKEAIGVEEAVATGSAEANAPPPAPFPYAEHEEAEATEKIEEPNKEAEEEAGDEDEHACEGICDAAGPGVCQSEEDAIKPACHACAECHKKAAVSHAVLSAERAAAGSALGSFDEHYEHHEHGDEAWKQFHVPFPTLPNPKPFAKGNSPGDDLEDLEHQKKNSVGCDPILGCREPPPPCEDKDSLEICEDYVANGDCQFDFVIKNCKKSCDLCPKPEGAIASDAYTGPAGHYYLGGARRRVGAGFGRRRRTPAPPAPVAQGSALGPPPPEPPKTMVEKVAVDILHPNGKEVVPVPKKAKDCKNCVKMFEVANGCKVWQDGSDATALVPEGCMVCAKELSEACGVTKPLAGDDEIPKPIEHPNQAAKQEEAVEHEDKKEDKDVPNVIKKAADKVMAVVNPDAKGAEKPEESKEVIPVEGTKAAEAMGSGKAEKPQEAEKEVVQTEAKAAKATKIAEESNEEAAKAEAKAVKAEAKVAEVKPAKVEAAKVVAGIAKEAAEDVEARAVKEQTKADDEQADADNAKEVAHEAEKEDPIPVDKHLAPYTKTEDSWCPTEGEGKELKEPHSIKKIKGTPLDACADECGKVAACASFGLEGTTCVLQGDCEIASRTGFTVYLRDIKNMPKPEDQIVDEESKDWAQQQMEKSLHEVGEVSGDGGAVAPL